ncbi:MAG: M3 family metallopeptidase [Gammaproteobacteria bacterium]|nr:M3 family metallopeptidase [Gammaproteobacteria bacterium]
MFATQQQLATTSMNDQDINSISRLKQKLFQLPLDFSQLTVEKIKEYFADIEKLYQATYDQIASLSGNPDMICFETVVQPLLDLEVLTEKAVTLSTLPRYVHPDQETRSFSASITEALQKLSITYTQREDVFKVFHQYEFGAFQSETSFLHPEEIRYFEHLMRNYKRNGLYISDPTIRAEIARIKMRITECCVQFKQNLNEENTHFIFSKEDLKGLPEDWFTDAKQVAAGQYKVTLNYTDVFPILDLATNRDIRRKIFTAFDNRCKSQNLPLIKEVLTLRQQLAKLLGYKNFVDYATEIKMAKDGDTIKKFLDEMNEKFNPVLIQNLNDLTAFAREKENDPTFNLEIPDMRYYIRLYQESTCQIDMEEIRKYFPLDKVIQGTLDIYQQILGLKFISVDDKTVWHPDVLSYEVYEAETQSQLGKFHLDLHPRPGKYSHAAATDLTLRCDISRFTGIEGDKQLTIGMMMCNFAKNTNVPFKDMVTFFHEFGHVMHFICGKTKLATFNGGSIERDFVEAPSQMLENWCYEPVALKILSAHEETGEPLPQAKAEKMKKLDVLDAGYHYKRQLTFAYFDYYIHAMSLNEIETLDINAFYQKIQHDTVQLPIIPETCFPATFGHIMGGYEAGYYGYMYAKVYSADMYATVFKSDPLSPENGKRYREWILAPGASQDAMKLLHNFLGRAPQVDAFLEHFELIDKKAECDEQNEPARKRMRK